MPSLVLPWWSQEVESRRNRQTLPKTKPEDQLQWALMLMRKRMNILVDYVSYRLGFHKYLTDLWCWAYPKVPDLPELHCNCDMGILILTWQLLNAMQEKKHHCNPSSWNIFGLHLLPGRSFLRVLPSADGKKLRRVLLKAQFKINPNLRSTGGRVVQNFKCWISTADTFGPSKMFAVVFGIKCIKWNLAVYLLFKTI